MTLQEAVGGWLTHADLLQVLGHDFGVLIISAEFGCLFGEVLQKAFKSEGHELWSTLLDLANFFVGLHNFLEPIEWQLLTLSFSHFQFNIV